MYMAATEKVPAGTLILNQTEEKVICGRENADKSSVLPVDVLR